MMIQQMDLVKDLNCTTFFNQQIQKTQGDYQNYCWIITMRLCIILFSSIGLLLNILLIIKRKQSKKPIIFLFMLVQIFYLVSLLSVTTHNKTYNSPAYTGTNSSIKYKYMIELFQPDNYTNVQPENSTNLEYYFDCLVETGNHIPSAIEGLINLSCYAISYWMAVCIAIYVRHVLDKQQKQSFWKKKLTLIVSVGVGIFLWYLVPFCLTMIQGMPFSFGPVGYKFETTSQLFFYGGLVNRTGEDIDNILLILWMLLVQLAMLVYHLRLLYLNWHTKKQIVRQDRELTQEEYYIMRAGNISIIIFVVQLLNIVKLALTFVNYDKQCCFFNYLILILNIIYDLLAFCLIIMYFMFFNYKGNIEDDQPQEKNTNSLLQRIEI